MQGSYGKCTYALNDVKVRTACYMYLYTTLVHCHKCFHYLEDWAEQNALAYKFKVTNMLLSSWVKIAPVSSQGLLSDTCFLSSLWLLPVFHVSPHIPPCISMCLFLLSSDLLQLLLRCLSTKEMFQSRAGSCTVPQRHTLRTPTLTPWAKRQQHVHFWACCCKVACVPLTAHTPLWKPLLCVHLIPCAVGIVQVAQEKQQENKMFQVCDSTQFNHVCAFVYDSVTLSVMAIAVEIKCWLITGRKLRKEGSCFLQVELHPQGFSRVLAIKQKARETLSVHYYQIHPCSWVFPTFLSSALQEICDYLFQSPMLQQQQNWGGVLRNTYLKGRSAQGMIM